MAGVCALPVLVAADDPQPLLPPAVELGGVEGGKRAARPSPAPAAKVVVAENQRTSSARLQAFLARSGFSPGLIDGKPGKKTKVALEDYRRVRGVDPTVQVQAGEPTSAASAVAPLASGVPWTRLYRITEADAALVTGPVPMDWNERAALAVSGYESLHELLSERGWCTVETVAWLNPGLVMSELKVGDEVVLPDVPDPFSAGTKPAVSSLPRLARVEIELSNKLVRGFDDAGVQVSLMHCSVAQAVEKRPVGELKVKVVATDPEYTFDPKDWPEVEGITSKLRIAPGPRNPVGSAWVGLDLPGYGMHGTVRPQDIGKTGSHGCFRLANWDAVRLARAVKVGTVVVVKE